MIAGARYWSDRSRYYTQTNNSIEGLLKKFGGRWLETCGPTAAATCLDMLGYDLAVKVPGAYAPQAEDVLTLALNDPRHAEVMKQIRADVSGVPGNRVPQYYPWAVRIVFNAAALFVMPLRWVTLTDEIKSGNAVQICRVDPGHYLAAVAFDDVTREVIYHDPWPQGQPDGQGFAKRINESQWGSEFHAWGVVYEV